MARRVVALVSAVKGHDNGSQVQLRPGSGRWAGLGTTLEPPSSYWNVVPGAGMVMSGAGNPRGPEAMKAAHRRFKVGLRISNQPRNNHLPLGGGLKILQYFK